ncbi:FAD-dependent oxidoreductase [Paenibacillus enshidis]|uniref:FAD-dependent oxidoreductase n=1 Tax=Paenibacillus enshidis TaxID=1458439 RepID=A0ABV5B0H5_9BACL
MDQRLYEADMVIVGGSLGGTAAALAAAKAGMKVIMTEETDWIGGQLTSQAVPPDEHRWIESFGCTASYREFRNRVRDYYRVNYPLTEEARQNPVLNPGNGWVSRLCHEPVVALRVLEDMLSPYMHSGRLKILYHTKIHRAEICGDMVTSVIVRNRKGDEILLRGAYYLDATDCGDLLPLAGAEFATGAESASDTGEPHAMKEANPLDMQSITHVAAVEYVEGGNFVIDRPDDYSFWKSYKPDFSPFPILSWHASDANDMTKMKKFTMFPNVHGTMSLWDYRRIVDPSQLSRPLYEGEITLLNWPQNDYYLGPVIGVSPEERARHLRCARSLTLALIYWLQTEAPRMDGGTGYPGIRLWGEVLGTKHGLAKTPYIRESRRIKALYTITEHDVSKELRGNAGIKRYKDSVGVGSYHLDLHPTTVTQRSFYIPTYPYEIPLGSLIPVRIKNLLPACKNIGMTQIANGCYRLHPTEWNIGESAALLAVYAIRSNQYPYEIKGSSEHLCQYQKLLQEHGVELHWPEGLEGV